MIHFYDFDSFIPTTETFDISSCFHGNQLTEFAIKFNYPKGISKDTPFRFIQKFIKTINNNVYIDSASFKQFFEFEVLKEFYKKILENKVSYNFSPFRILPPKTQALDDSFVIYTGITDPAPALSKQHFHRGSSQYLWTPNLNLFFAAHFNKLGQVKCDTSKAKYQISSVSAENCAFVCLNSSIVFSDTYKCLSFDFCSDSNKCAFYSFSHLTDPNVITETAPLCDHYSSKTFIFSFSYWIVVNDWLLNSRNCGWGWFC